MGYRRIKTPPISLKNSIVIIIVLEIPVKSYNFDKLYKNWSSLEELKRCPSCRAENKFSRHSKYKKYHKSKQIGILVLKCNNCMHYHAVIPSFSLPGTSLDSQEYESYHSAREAGKSRSEASKCFPEQSRSKSYLRMLEKRFEICCDRLKALLPFMGDIYLNGLDYHRSVLKSRDHLICGINKRCLENQINAVFCNRRNILLFWDKKTGNCLSNNLTPTRMTPFSVDSS